MNEKWMKLALKQALKAKELGEIPIGAVVVSAQGEVLSQAHNLKESQYDPTGHAEIIAIRRATKSLKAWRLKGSTLYVTLEPCMMCAGALIQARLKEVIFGAYDPKGGCIETLTKGLELKGINHKVAYQGGVLREDCGQILTDFFKQKRN